MKLINKSNILPRGGIVLGKTISVVLLSVIVHVSAIAAQDLYAEGQANLDRRDWQAAYTTFKELSEVKGDRQDAALYWLAYAQFKNKKSRGALSTIARLVDSYPDSSWLDDARALEVEIRDARGEALEIDDDELKLYAIDSLMNSSSDKTVPLLIRIIKAENSNKIKKRALFVLSQSETPEAYSAIALLASDDSNENLQEAAIHTLGVSGSEHAIPVLKKVYEATTNKVVKQMVLRSFMISDNSEELLDVARGEKNDDLKRSAVHLLGVMSMSDSLLQLYNEKEFAQQRKAIIHAIAIGDGIDELFEIASSEEDETLRVHAVEALGITGDSGVRLAKLYAEVSSRKLQAAVIKALFMQDDAKQLIELLKQENDPGLKREMLQSLSIMGSEDSDEFFIEILNGQN
jgi:HEAT repeat protein